MQLLTKNQRGLSLVELLVAMAVTLVLVIVASTAYLRTRGTYVATDEQSQLYEDGRFALGILGKSISQAGYVSYSSPELVTIVTNFRDAYSNGTANPQFRAISGCDGGYVSSTSVACTTSSNATSPDGFSVSYATEEDPEKLGIASDCLGNNAVGIASGQLTGAYLVTNRYFLRSSTQNIDGSARTVSALQCMGIGAPKSQPLVNGVVDMQIKYGIERDGFSVDKTHRNATDPTEVVHPASYVTANLISPITSDLNIDTNADGWDRVVSVNICLTMETIRPTTKVGTSNYVDCQGGAKVSPDGYIRKSFSSVYQIRSRGGKR